MNRPYYGWLAGSTLSAFGDSALFFALGWAATGIAPHVAGLVLTAFTLPRAVLLLLGGVLGDRWGPRRVLISCSAIVGACCFGLAAAVAFAGSSATLLILTAAVIGTVDAFALPAAGALPRLFVTDDDLPKAMAMSTSANQVVRLAGGPMGGLFVASLGLAGALTIDAATFAVLCCVLLAIKPPYDVQPSADRKSVARDALDGIRVAWSDRTLRTILLVVAAVAAFVLPVTSLCIPLLARAHAWSATQTGLIVAATVTGSLLVTLVAARRGTSTRPNLTAGLGCLLGAAGITALTLSPSPWLATAAALLQGLGVGLFTSHLAPVFVRATPRTHLTRLQSLPSLAQTIPLIPSTNLLAALNIHQALTLCATTTALAGLTLTRLALTSTTQRGAAV
ncbi:MFS transporter [Kribbella sp. NPDC050820]|uniref:MFS transporter n=1 Tax=Kribbella sp. NPDC050820 TaxID=3155408 RepID=UPI00340C6D35